ncbi:hypothetical protein BUALT_Bualt01G0142700 [Buddleja alternifolia]|uniref:Retrotransposon gag domain-containing protein n=1 Tax=Buddleja alternifolia TaxID=168488 RepID=A0AAV6YCY5_9LAMI|nr:hypothetical protein BUALT_Bualt01G0142700 [Buddleja alternifolia]
MFEKNDRMFEDIRTMIAAMASRTANGGNSPTIDTDETLSEAKVRLAALHLDDKVLQWHQVYMRARLTHELPGWEEYIKALHDRFGSVTFEDPMLELMNLRQVSSVKDYLDKFDELLNNVDLSEAYAVSCFLVGLKNEIAVQVRMFKPKSFQEAASLAKLQEQAFILAAKRNVGFLKHNSTFQKNTPLLPTPPQSYNSSFKNNLPPSTTPKPTGKRLTPQELEEKRAKGLCFLCDERYSREHIYAKKRQLYILDMNEDLDGIMVEHLPVDNDMFDTHDTPDEFPHNNFHISMNAMSGIHDFRTMRVTGSFKGKNIHILIDTGSTHNFIDVEAAKRLGCKLEATQCFPVSVADGNKFFSQAVCKQFSWRMQGVNFFTDLMVLPLGGCEMVLGIQWLITLGDISWNFHQLRMEFQYEGKKVALRGMQPQSVKIIDKNKMQKCLHKPAQISMLHMGILHEKSHDLSEDPFCYNLSATSSSEPLQELQAILDDYQDLFAEPTTLPPPREQDHAINLKEGTNPIST